MKKNEGLDGVALHVSRLQRLKFFYCIYFALFWALVVALTTSTCNFYCFRMAH